MKGLIYNEKRGFSMKGSSTLFAFEPGVIPTLMAQGKTLEEAMAIAMQKGKCSHRNTVNNLIVNAGLALVGAVLIGDAAGFSYHAIGTGSTTPAEGDTQLTTEVSRMAITSTSQSSYTITLLTFYLSTLCAYDLKEGAVYGGAATATPNSGTLFSHFLQSFNNSSSPQDLTYQYNLEVTR